MLITVQQISKNIGRSESAVKKGARLGRFGKAAHHSGNRWLFDSPEAEIEFKRRTDPTRYSPAQTAPGSRNTIAAAPEASEGPSSVVYESARGRLEVSQAQHAALLHADDHPDLPLLTPELVAILDQIMFIVGPPPDVSSAVSR